MDINLTIGAIALIPIIVAIIEALKAAGVPVKYAPWLNAVLSVLGYALVVFVQTYPVYEQPVVLALNVLIIFLGAAGFYDTAKRTVG